MALGMMEAQIKGVLAQADMDIKVRGKNISNEDFANIIFRYVARAIQENNWKIERDLESRLNKYGR